MNIWDKWSNDDDVEQMLDSFEIEMSYRYIEEKNSFKHEFSTPYSCYLDFDENAFDWGV